MSAQNKQPPKLYTTFKGFLKDYRTQMRDYLQENARAVQQVVQERLCTPQEAEKVLQAGSDLLTDLDRREELGDGVIHIDEWKTFQRVRRREPANKGGF